ncbi:hypothetical protein [Sediminibacterium soli]|uniref:hypothetical protein n=1 Tax=Sediminibacterium soli TaxID=2698829 RepID=UPI00137A1B20|nr:hypothetical protein [Sediminibacterium soli]NCI45937.1 hypothetical protein [Sediminibacterium soli]
MRELPDWWRAVSHLLLHDFHGITTNGRRSAAGAPGSTRKLMQHALAGYFPFSTSSDTAFVSFTGLSGKIDMLLKINQEEKIYHTDPGGQGRVYPHHYRGGTKYARIAGYRYWGRRFY